jgi:hypothetical protein
MGLKLDWRGFWWLRGVPALSIPTKLTYAVRVAVPTAIAKLNFDFGIGQFAGKVYGSGPDTINVKARHQAGFQVSYSFGGLASR